MQGHTDYIVFIHRFAGDATIGDMDGVYSAWSTRHPEGFSDANLVAPAPPGAGARPGDQERRPGA